LIVLASVTVIKALPITPEQSEQIDAYVTAEMQERNIPGVALVVCLDGTILKEQAYGVAEVQNQSPVTTSTRFELASITKQFTASAIMVLQQDGKIDVDAEIHTYLPDAPENWRGVTVRHLLNHTSGLPTLGEDFSAGKDPDFVASVVRETGSVTGLIDASASIQYRMAKADVLQFTPGEKFLYSDVGYFLLGLIIERVSGTSYRDFLRDRIFEPAGMLETYILDQRTIHPNEARGYTLRGGQLENIRRIADREIPSHYGVFSNVRDMAKWNAVLGADGILTEGSKKQLWSPARLNSGASYPYGFGWYSMNRYGRAIQSHTGITGTEIVRFEEDGLCILVLTNQGQGIWNRGTYGNAWGLAPQIADLLGRRVLTGEDYVSLSGAAVVRDELPSPEMWVGEYTSDAGMTIRIQEDNDRLWFQSGGLRKPVGALDNGRLLILDLMTEYTLEMLPEQDGPKRTLVLHQNGQQQHVFTN